jgi:hypothetical protein
MSGLRDLPTHFSFWTVRDKIARIRSDYRDMREMFFTEPPPFDSLMADLKELEDRVNH